MERTFTVYIHITPDGKMYIGSTRYIPEKRFMNGKGYKHNKPFSEAITNCGWDNIKHVIIKRGLSAQEASTLEKSLIEQYNTTNPERGYNLTKGGENIGERGGRKVTLGEKLKYYREKANYSQNDVASILGIDQSAIAKYESDASIPNMVLGFRIAKLYGTTVEELATAKE